MVDILINTGEDPFSLSDTALLEYWGPSQPRHARDFAMYDREDPALLDAVKKVGLDRAGGTPGVNLEIAAADLSTLYSIVNKDKGYEIILYKAESDPYIWFVAGH